MVTWTTQPTNGLLKQRKINVTASDDVVVVIAHKQKAAEVFVTHREHSPDTYAIFPQVFTFVFLFCFA